MVFTEDEVWATIKEMPVDRALGPDGFIGLFFQKAWSIIKGDMMAALHHLFLGNGCDFGRLNQALITLIHKKVDACRVGDFRPISLVHSLPIGSKLLANRLRPRMNEIVQTNQSAFIKGRNLHDNFMLVRQVARFLHRRRVKGVMLNLDIS